MQRLKRFMRMYKNEVAHGAIVLLSVIIAVAVIIPQGKAIGHRYQLMREAEKNIVQLKEKQILLNSFESGDLESTYQLAMSTIPREKILGSMMIGLENLMSDYEITLLSFSFDSVGSIGTDSAAKKGKRETTAYSTIPITMTIEGKLSNIRNFLDSANRTRPLYLIKNFDLTFSQTGNLFRSKILMDAFYMPLPKSLGTVASTLSPFTENEKNVLEKISTFTELVHLSGSPAVNLPTSPMKSDPFLP